MDDDCHFSYITKIKNQINSKAKTLNQIYNLNFNLYIMRSEKKSNRDMGRYFLFFPNEGAKKYKVQLIEKKVKFLIYLNINRVFRIGS
jgi:hypothetical protein